jgi:hypothetical protein
MFADFLDQTALAGGKRCSIKNRDSRGSSTCQGELDWYGKVTAYLVYMCVNAVITPVFSCLLDLWFLR